MPNLLHFLRMMRWARHRPSRARMRVVLVTLAIVALVWGIEAAGLWPDWLTSEPVRRPRVILP